MSKVSSFRFFLLIRFNGSRELRVRAGDHKCDLALHFRVLELCGEIGEIAARDAFVQTVAGMPNNGLSAFSLGAVRLGVSTSTPSTA